VHSMETERGVGAVRQAYGPSTSFMTEVRTLLKMNARDESRIPVYSDEGHAEWKAVSEAAARKRSAARASGEAAPGSHAAKFIAALAAAKAKAAADGEPRQRRKRAKRAAAARAPTAGSERRAIVKKLNYVSLQKELLLDLNPSALIAGMKKPDVVAALCDEGCGSIEELRAGAALLELQRVEMAASVKTRSGLTTAVADLRRRAVAAGPTDDDGWEEAAAEDVAAADLADADYPDTECCGCGSAAFNDTDQIMLLCEGCHNGCHMACLQPAMDTVPIDDWYCPECDGGG
jgi:hypothetical protein